MMEAIHRVFYRSNIMRKIQLKDAKAKLSTIVDDATRGKPSLILRHGNPEAVVLGFADWQRLSRVPDFGRLLMSAPRGQVFERTRPEKVFGSLKSKGRAKSLAEMEAGVLAEARRRHTRG
jgi:prevent-host-death family protein